MVFPMNGAGLIVYSYGGEKKILTLRLCNKNCFTCTEDLNIKGKTRKLREDYIKYIHNFTIAKDFLTRNKYH